MTLHFTKALARAAGIDTRAAYQALSAASLRAAMAEQGLTELAERLRLLVPDLSQQYTSRLDPVEYARYWETKMRGLHAFQMQFLLDAVAKVAKPGLNIADLGDSSGNHGIYLRGLAPEGAIGRYVSVNLDPVAVEKVKAKGGEAVLCPVEELDLASFVPDLVVSFETFEHLSNPLMLFHTLATQCPARHVLITVPYRRHSRFGGTLMRMPLAAMPAELTPEAVHLYEFSPEDWSLMARFGGFKTVAQRIYVQYPRRSPLRVTAPLWRRLDHEGFLGLLLERDLSLAERYSGW